jgi:glutamate-5-semialdehyde dehydrogenase
VLIHRNIPNYVARVQEMIDILRQADIEVLFMNDVNNELSKVEHTIDKGLLSEEFLAAKILLSPVDDLDQAVEWINTYSGGHSATIITDNVANAEIFQDQVDCAAVYHNASTRFTDGGEFGFGAEIAISTQKLHFRGPIGIHQLVTNKWFVSGNGQTR